MHRCDSCGLKSNIDLFFRSEKAGLFGFSKTVCEGCTVYNPDRYEHLLFAALKVFFGFWAVQAIVIFCINPSAGMILTAMVVASFASLPLRTMCHEAGHASVAKVLGYDIIDVTIGSGPFWVTFRVGRSAIVLRRYLYSGGCVRCLDMRGPYSRWREIAITFAGPATNVVCALLLFRLSHHFIVGVRTFAADMTAAALAGAALSHIFMAIINLIPWRSRDEEAKNDGRQLLDLLCRWQNPDAESLTYQRIGGLMQTRRFEEAADAALSAAKSSVRPISLISMALHCVSRSFGDQAAVNCYLERVDQIEQAITAGDEADLQSFPWLQANVAWSAIKGRCDDLHDLIERFSREALETFPEAPEMKGTRGIWLIESGHHDAGLPLLTEAVRCISDPHDKADFCTFLAQGWKAMGDTVRSEGYQQLREHLMGQQSHAMTFAPISV